MSVSRRRISLAVRLAALGAAVVAVGLAMSVPANAIANGTLVPEGMYRFAVKLTMTNIPRPDGSRSNSGCSAGLIAPRWIITILPASCSSSAISWLVTITVMRFSRLRSVMNWSIERLASTSSPSDGSSRKRISGSCTKAEHSASFWRLPRE